jgi:hypothetical protein
MKKFNEFRSGLVEAPVDGVAPGSLENDKHMCASKIFHKEWKEGTPVIGEHAEPDETGNISWYSVMFEHGIETVQVDDLDVEVVELLEHGNHKKKK